MRGGEGQVAEKRLPAGRLLLHPRLRLAEEHVGCVALELSVDAVVQVDVVEVVVVKIPGGRRDARRLIPDGFLKPAVLRTVGVVVAQVPLAEQSGAVAGLGENLGHRWKVAAQIRAAAADVHRAVAQRIDPGHQLTARRRAHRGCVEIREANALRVQPIHVRGLEHGVAVHGEIPVALIVNHHDHDVRFRGDGGGGRANAGGEAAQQQAGQSQDGGAAGGGRTRIGVQVGVHKSP